MRVIVRFTSKVGEPERECLLWGRSFICFYLREGNVLLACRIPFPFPQVGERKVCIARLTGKLGEGIVYLSCGGPLGLDVFATRDSHQCEYAGGNGRACSQQMALTVSGRGLEAAISNRNFELIRALRRAQFFLLVL